MKKLVLSATLLAALILAACSETTTESVSGNVESKEPVQETNEAAASEVQEEVEEVEEEATETSNAINQVIIDSEKYKITLLEILKKQDDIWGNEINVVYEVENKLAETIGVQARSVSADGYMVDEGILSMSQEVVGGKKAKAILTISDYEGYDFPELNSDLEMTLHIFNYDTFEGIEDVPVKVTF